jgi:uncharacterized membrane protein
MAKLKAYLLTGLVIVIPVFLTIYVLVWLFNFLDGILGRLLTPLFIRFFGFYPPGVGFLLSLLLIILIGFVVKKWLGRRVAFSIEKQFSGLPLVRYIYPAVKKVVLFVSQQRKMGFSKVVLVEYPRKGIWSLGFLTNDQYAGLNKVTGKDLVSVFISTTPGPLSGSVIFFPREDVLFPEISVNKAINIILSGGVFKGDDPLIKTASVTLSADMGKQE